MQHRSFGDLKVLVTGSAVIVLFFSAGLSAAAQDRLLDDVQASPAEVTISAPSSTPAPTPYVTTSPTPEKPTVDKTKEVKKEKRYSLVPIPIPINSPTFGTGMILGLGVVLKLNEKDMKSRPSSFGFVTAFTNNGTRGGALAGKMYFGQGKYQAKFAVGAGKANYE